jgi:hypothetical protein
MKTHLVLTSIFFLSAAGCAPGVKKEDIFAQARQIKAAAILPALIPGIVKPASQESPFAGQERLVYKARYLGLPIGEFIIVNQGKTTLNGRPAYRFELTVHTLPFFGLIKDRYVSYLDAEKLVVLRHEEYVRKGTRLESTVDFDYQTRTALYKDAVSGQEKKVAIPESAHDIVTGGFYLRTAPMGLGDAVELNVYADEKLYNYVGLLESKTTVKVPGRGRQDVFVLKSYLFHGGRPVKSISAEVFFSTDEYRKPLRAILRTLFGNVSVMLIDG